MRSKFMCTSTLGQRPYRLWSVASESIHPSSFCRRTIARLESLLRMVALHCPAPDKKSAARRQRDGQKTNPPTLPLLLACWLAGCVRGRYYPRFPRHLSVTRAISSLFESPHPPPGRVELSRSFSQAQFLPGLPCLFSIWIIWLGQIPPFQPFSPPRSRPKIF